MPSTHVSRYTVTGPVGRYAHLATIFGLDAEQRLKLLLNGDLLIGQREDRLRPVAYLTRPATGEHYLLLHINPNDPWTAFALVERAGKVQFEGVDLETLAHQLIATGDALEIDRGWTPTASAADYYSNAEKSGRLNPYFVAADAAAALSHDFAANMTLAALAALEELIAMGLQVYPYDRDGAVLEIGRSEGNYSIMGPSIGEDLEDEHGDGISPAVCAVLERHGLCGVWDGPDYLMVHAKAA